MQTSKKLVSQLSLQELSVDFSRVSETDATGAYMLLPVVTNAQRGNITAAAGGLIYNSDTNKLQVFNGTSWETVTSS